MKTKKLIALSSAIILGTTTVLMTIPNTVRAQEHSEEVTEEMQSKTETIVTESVLPDNTEKQLSTPEEPIIETNHTLPITPPPVIVDENQPDSQVNEEAAQNNTKDAILETDTQKDKTQSESDDTVLKNDGIPLNETHFPDNVFRSHLSKQADSNQDGYLSQDEVSRIKSLFLSDSNLSNLKGIEYLTALESLKIYYSSMTSLNLTGLSNLHSLKIYENNLLTTLDLTLPNLKSLDCSSNALSTLTLKTPNLVTLDCFGNCLTSLDVSNLAALTSVEYSNNADLKTLDFRGCFNLKVAHHSIQQETVYISAGMVKYIGCNAINEHTGNIVIDLDNFYTINADNSKSVDLSKVISPTLIHILEQKNHPFVDSETHTLTIPATEHKTVLEAGFDNYGHATHWTFFTDITAVDDCTVKFDSMGGSPIEDLIVQKNAIATEPTAPAKDGYLFKGWYLDQEYSNAYDFSTPVSNDLVLYARWEKQISENTPPIINASDKVLTVGDSFDPLKDASASDKEDGKITLTKEHIIENDVDTSKPGIYHVTYKVTDKNNSSTKRTITVTVKKAIPKKQSKIPLTGDLSNLGLFTSMLTGSSGLLAILANKKRKNR